MEEEADTTILFEELSDFELTKRYLRMAIVSLRTGGELPPVIAGIFDVGLLDELGVLFEEIGKLRRMK